MTAVKINASMRDVLIGAALVWPLVFLINFTNAHIGPVRGVNWFLIVSSGVAAFWFGRIAGNSAAVFAAIGFSTVTASGNGAAPSIASAFLTLGAALTIVGLVDAARQQGVKRQTVPRAAIGWLPFIADTKAGRTFWAVTETDNYTADCEAGAALAAELIADIRRQNRPELLGWVVSDMVARGKMTGVEVGFMAEIARSVADHNPDNPATKARIVQGHHNGHAGPVNQ